MLTEEQKAFRRKGVFASDVAAIMGLSPWKTALDVFLEKAHPELATNADSIEIDIGNALEPVALARYARATGCVVVPHGSKLHPDFPEVGATPDGLVFGERPALWGVEAKTAGKYTSHYWTEEEIPDFYRPQVEICASVFGTSRWDVAAIIEGELFIYELQADATLAKLYIDAARTFWHEHVLKDLAPPATDPDSHAAYLAKRYPANRGTLIPSTPEAVGLATLIREAKAKEKRATAAKKGLENELKMLIGDADGIEGVATWRRAKDSTVPAHTRKGSRRLLLTGERDE